MAAAAHDVGRARLAFTVSAAIFTIFPGWAIATGVGAGIFGGFFGGHTVSIGEMRESSECFYNSRRNIMSRPGL